MLWLLLVTLLSAGQVFAVDPGYYTAAVVELNTPRREAGVSADQILVDSAALYVEYIANASLSEVDVIVFPEDGLVGRYNEGKAIELPSAADNFNPCVNTSSYHQVLTVLSCAARRYKMYTVVTLGEMFFNTTRNSTQLFTSSLAFDRNGTIIARYRKYHPYGKNADIPPLELTYFETDFGITFGMLISFDIQFEEPGIVMARKYGIKDFIFPHCWVSALPFFTAVQTQWSWAYALDVSLLASGCNDPSKGGTGSGIYSRYSHGALHYLQTSDVRSELIIARVPTILDFDEHLEESAIFYRRGEKKEISPNRPEEGRDTSSFYLLRDYVDVYASLLLPSSGSDKSVVLQGLPQNSSLITRYTSDTSLCQNTLCCAFQITVANTFNTNPATVPPRPDDFTRLWYRLVAFDGVRSYGGGVATGGVQLCGIISCVNESLSSCALPGDHPSAQEATLGPLFKTGTVFETVAISAKLLYNNTFVYPDILVTGSGHRFGALMSPYNFSFTTSTPEDNTVNATLKLNEPVSNLVTLAIYARQFDRDGQNRTELPSTNHSGAASQGILPYLLLIVANILF